MEGFTVSNANRFLDTGALRDSKSLTVEGPSSIGSTSNADGKSFADTLKEAVSYVNELQKASDKFAQNVATGKTDDVAGAMIAAERADIALRVMVQVRNKIVQAYQQVSGMQF